MKYGGNDNQLHLLKPKKLTSFSLNRKTELSILTEQKIEVKTHHKKQHDILKYVYAEELYLHW